jgi:hypothetical protein
MHALRFLALATCLAIVCAACVATIGPVLVENRTTNPMVVRAFGRTQAELDVILTLALPAGSKVVVGRDAAGASIGLIGVEILTQDCALRAAYSLDTDREGGQIVVNEDGSIKRIGKGTVAPAGVPATATDSCVDPNATPHSDTEP